MRYDDLAEAGLRAFIEKKNAVVLAIETSCDETSAALVRGGRETLSNAVYSQIPIHQRYGGVVPEIASRNHISKLPETVNEALTSAGLDFEDIDAVAVTASPGLVGALLTGVSYAKGLAFARGLPLIGVNHIAGHIAANYLSAPWLEPPFTCLVASGGHSHIYQVDEYESLRLLGATRDDAAGEAFDKVARVLGLDYPGGPALERLAKDGDAHAHSFPGGFNAADGPDFSFSGLKTAVINLLHTALQRAQTINPADVAASFEHTLIEVLVAKALRAAKLEGSRTLALSGGVSANSALRERMSEAAQAAGLRFISPLKQYCGDNAAMIGCAAYYALKRGRRDGLNLNARAR